MHDEARAAFSERELVDRTWAVGRITSGNRLAVAFRVPPNVPDAPRADPPAGPGAGRTTTK